MKDSPLPHPTKMFKVIAEANGLMDEYNERLERLVAEDGKFGARGRCPWKAMAEMGWDTDRIKREYLSMTHTQEVKTKAEALIRMSSDIEDALRELGVPSVAQPSAEMEWVSGHPAMMRLDMDDKLERVFITRDDIVNAPAGPPPSHRAVTQLVHWANRPNEFHKQLLTVHRKAEFVGDEQAEEEAADMTLQELRALIKQFAS